MSPNNTTTDITPHYDIVANNFEANADFVRGVQFKGIS
jgi:hypothetical protein